MGFLSKILGYFQSGKKTILSQEDIKALGFFDNMSYPYEDSYRENGKKFVKQYGPLLRVEYLSHYPKFEINFVFNKFIVYSGSRGNSYDINFLSLGYIGEGPRYSKYFLEGVGFILSDNEIKNIKPGAVIEKIESTVTVNYPENPEIQKAQTSEIYKTELFDAIDEENINKVNELLHHYSLDLDKLNDDYNIPGPGYHTFSALCFAVYKNNIKLVECLLKCGADINAKGASGGWGTALYLAARERYLEMAEFLLKEGAKLDIGHSPLMCVTQGQGDMRFVELFLKKGAPVGVDENDYSEQTPLHQVYAPQIIMMLIKAGADVNKQDKYKNSPLHYAAENDELAAAEILLESGADPFSKGGEWIDIESDSLPFDHAKSQKMRNLLKSYMKNKKKRR